MNFQIDISINKEEILKANLMELERKVLSFEEIMVLWLSSLVPGYCGEISILFCGDNTSAMLNKQYRKKENATDVLSFPQLELQDGLNWHNSYLTEPLGDIVINVNQAKKQSLFYKIDFYTEILMLACHGLLHLLGYDHEKSRERAILMEETENKLILLASP